MALTRKMLEAMSIEAEKIESIIEAHAETVNALKLERDGLKDQLAAIDTTKDWKTLFTDEHAAFEAYKSEQTQKEISVLKNKAYMNRLIANGILPKQAESIAKISKDYIAALELGEDGECKDASAVDEAIKAEWAGFIPELRVEGVRVATPPTTSTRPTKDQILGIKNDAERLDAIAKNLDLFDNV